MSMQCAKNMWILEWKRKRNLEKYEKQSNKQRLNWLSELMDAICIQNGRYGNRGE